MLTADECGYLAWRGASDNGEVRDGVDAFVIRDGRIVSQMIQYNVHCEAQR